MSICLPKTIEDEILGDNMVKIKFVFPNLQNGQNRQGLSERWRLAKLFNCSYIEVPAIFVHNPFEAKITGKKFGEFFNEKDIMRLYENEDPIPDDFNYFFHTDPGFSDKGYQPECIRWFDPQWVSNYTKMLVTIAGVLGKHPKVIEIHPGSPKNTAENLVDAQYLLQSGYEEQTGYTPRIVLENLTASHVKSGIQLSKINHLIEDKYPEMINSCGLVIDMSGIRSAWKNKAHIDYRESLAAIPKTAVKGIHFHCNHGRDPVDMNTEFWKYVTNWIHSIPSCIFLNPEVHSINQFEPLFEICQEEFSRKKANSQN
jgi:hypothetical protein